MSADGINFVDELDASIIVCDCEGIILYLNKRAIKNYEKSGGEKLIGTNLLDCHPEPAKSKLKELLLTQQSNTYTIEKNGVKKIILQKPWYENGEYKGFFEMSVEIPKEMNHFIRK